MNTNEVTRYQQFRQFRSEIKKSSDYLVIGIDVAKDKHYSFFGSARGETFLRRLIFENSITGFEKLKSRIESIQAARGKQKIVLGLEPTGNYHKALGQWLIDQCYQLVLVTGKAVKENRETLDGRWDKNDTKDSANVADLVAQGKCQFYENPDPQIIQLRNLLSLRKRLKREEHSLRMRIRNSLVCKYFPEMDRCWGTCLQENLSIVRYFLDPKKITAMTFRDFLIRVSTKDRGDRQLKRLRKIYDAAADSIGCPVGPGAEFEAEMLVERLLGVRKRIEETRSRVKEVAEQFASYKKLQTIPGIGPYISALIIATIGDPNRFKSYKQVIRLAGLDLNAKRSGKRSNLAVPVISKRGDADLRYGLYQAALIASYRNEHFIKYYTRTLKGRERERGIRTKMRVKLASKLLIIAWTLMKKSEEFDPSLLT
ncbi:MAG: IS110 family transposase [Deltaproteobacteria bacterium]|nr:IS110 family transposase [Deltaproteobacteria bacterium]